MVQSGGGSSSPLLLGRAEETSGHRALGLVEEALRRAHCEREEIEAIAVGLGPGSYTGIRGAIALAQGWQLGRGINLLGLGSVESLAARAAQEKMSGPVNIIIDAQRSEFYLARYEIGPASWRELEGLRLASFAENGVSGPPRRTGGRAGRFAMVSVGARPLSGCGDFGPAGLRPDGLHAR